MGTQYSSGLWWGWRLKAFQLWYQSWSWMMLFKSCTDLNHTTDVPSHFACSSFQIFNEHGCECVWGEGENIIVVVGFSLMDGHQPSVSTTICVEVLNSHSSYHSLFGKWAFRHDADTPILHWYEFLWMSTILMRHQMKCALWCMNLWISCKEKCTFSYVLTLQNINNDSNLENIAMPFPVFLMTGMHGLALCSGT